MKKVKAELLAPAGSYDTMKAVFLAGADAVYMGGPLFGARAYADNPDTEGFLAAIDYAHLRNKKIYMTINTCFKETELKGKLYDYLLPFYMRGLDAVIVQDMGVFRFVKETFPDLPIHISTQMTVTGAESAKYFKNEGAARIVTARELSLEELKAIAEVGIEVESFVHGAICYCYSGKCLFSSIAGGRSGNRGRCAQPCRQPVNVLDANGKRLNKGNENYILSLKDMNTIEILPEILDSGVYSLKIEGRMKKPEYAAGVVSIYRKYLDKYLCGCWDGVSEEDLRRLFDLFNRNGFSSGYYKQHNSRDMLALTEVSFRSHDDEYAEYIKNNYINKELKRKISISITMLKDSPVKVVVYDGEYCIDKDYQIPEESQNRPITKEQVIKQFTKLGATDFEIENIDVCLDDGLFLPVSVMNEIRRDALYEFKNEILGSFFREAKSCAEFGETDDSKYEAQKISCQVNTMLQAKLCINKNYVKRIYAAYNSVSGEAINELIRLCHDNNKELYLFFSEPFRKEYEEQLDKQLNDDKLLGVDGFLCDSIESACYFKNKYPDKRLVAGHSLYTWNSCAIEELSKLCDETTVPYELKGAEFKGLGYKNRELIVYGYIPMMITANCVFKTTCGCKKNQGSNLAYILDKQGRRFPVVTDCSSCQNTIYNYVPEVLFDIKGAMDGFYAARIVFTIEDKRETERVLEAFEKGECLKEFTRGNYKKGAE